MASDDDKKIACHICCERVDLVRSVKIRRWIEVPDRESMARMIERPGEYEQYVRQMTFRRAFVCLRCYSVMDNPACMATFVIDGEDHTWGLSGDSRRGKAATYDFDKWSRFQSRQAAKMGIDLPDSEAR